MLEKLAEELRKKAKGIKESNFISKETLEKLSNYKPILKIEDQETGEIKEVKHFISRYAKEIMENFYVIEAKSEHKDTGLKAGIKISKATHHSLANIPVSTKAIKDNFRSSKMLFYPAKEIIHEVEITGISEEETSKFKTIRIIRLYYNRIKKLPITAKIIQAKITPNEIQTISHHEDIVNNPEKLAKFCKENANRKTIIYKEELINDFSTLKDSLAKISKEEIVIINEEGEEENYKVEKTRPVGKLIFGMAYDKELKEFPAILPINIFTRKDIIEKKESIKFPESHKYITNEKSLKVNYDNMFLKSIDFSHPVLISHATATNQKDHSFEIIIPVFRLKEDWEDVEELEIAKALIQIKGINKVIKDEKTYSLKFKEQPINRIFNFEKPKIEKTKNLFQKELKEIQTVIELYETMQKIKEEMDKEETI